MQMFVLTREEQRTIAFIVLMLLLGFTVKHYRATHPPAAVPSRATRMAGQRLATPAQAQKALPSENTGAGD
jgi:hypothetical protein